jgi:hypothetical protein
LNAVLLYERIDFVTAAVTREIERSLTLTALISPARYFDQSRARERAVDVTHSSLGHEVTRSWLRIDVDYNTAQLPSGAKKTTVGNLPYISAS